MFGSGLLIVDFCLKIMYTVISLTKTIKKEEKQAVVLQYATHHVSDKTCKRATRNRRSTKTCYIQTIDKSIIQLLRSIPRPGFHAESSSEYVLGQLAKVPVRSGLFAL